MGLLDDVLGSAVPGGSLAKPIAVAAAALLAARATGAFRDCFASTGCTCTCLGGTARWPAWRPRRPAEKLSAKRRRRRLLRGPGFGIGIHQEA